MPAAWRVSPIPVEATPSVLEGQRLSQFLPVATTMATDTVESGASLDLRVPGSLMSILTPGHFIETTAENPAHFHEVDSSKNEDTSRNNRRGVGRLMTGSLTRSCAIRLHQPRLTDIVFQLRRQRGKNGAAKGDRYITLSL